MQRRPIPATSRNLLGPRTPIVTRVAGVVAVAAALALCVQGSVSSAGHHEPAILVGYGSNLATAQQGPAARATVPARLYSVSWFSIAGTVNGLYPGKTLPLALTISNPLPVAITVKSITTTVSNASSTCNAVNVAVTAFSGTLVVPSHRSAKATVKATMRRAAPNACQGKLFPFHYTGTAT